MENEKLEKQFQTVQERTFFVIAQPCIRSTIQPPFAKLVKAVGDTVVTSRGRVVPSVRALARRPVISTVSTVRLVVPILGSKACPDFDIFQVKDHAKLTTVDDVDIVVHSNCSSRGVAGEGLGELGEEKRKVEREEKVHKENALGKRVADAPSRLGKAVVDCYAMPHRILGISTRVDVTFTAG